MSGAFVLHRAVTLTTLAFGFSVDVVAPAWIAVGAAMVYTLSMHTWVLYLYDRLHPA